MEANSCETTPSQRRDRLCTAAMVLGILAVVIPFAELLLAIPTIAIALAGLRRVGKQPELYAGKNMAMAGLILGIIALAICVPSVLILNDIL